MALELIDLDAQSYEKIMRGQNAVRPGDHFYHDIEARGRHTADLLAELGIQDGLSGLADRTCSRLIAGGMNSQTHQFVPEIELHQGSDRERLVQTIEVVAGLIAPSILKVGYLQDHRHGGYVLGRVFDVFTRDFNAEGIVRAILSNGEWAVTRQRHGITKLEVIVLTTAEMVDYCEREFGFEPDGQAFSP
jgi:hypothetical protein